MFFASVMSAITNFAMCANVETVSVMSLFAGFTSGGWEFAAVERIAKGEMKMSQGPAKSCDPRLLLLAVALRHDLSGRCGSFRPITPPNLPVNQKVPTFEVGILGSPRGTPFRNGNGESQKENSTGRIR
jgi:hypothetical protein